MIRRFRLAVPILLLAIGAPSLGAQGTAPGTAQAARAASGATVGLHGLDTYLE